MLNQHPDIAWHPEFDFMSTLINKNPKGEELASLLSNDMIFLQYGLEVDCSASFAENWHRFIGSLRSRAPKKHLGITVHQDFENIPLVSEESRYVWLDRDPRDIAISVISMGWAGNAWYATERWLTARESLRKLRQQIGEEKIHCLTYEALVSEPERTLRELCEFIGVDYDESMLHYPLNSSYGPVTTDSLNHWRRKMPKFQVRLVEERTRNEMASTGYAESGLKRIPAIQLRLFVPFLWLENKCRTKMFRIRRFGVTLLFGRFASRVLGLRSLCRSFDRQIMAINALHLK